jgi:glyoxylase-like metal-dependent hydrolase (beta-lactamase superfamily II)
MKADNSLAFPNAEVLVPAPEHKYWTDAGEESRSPTPRIADNFKNVHRVMGNAEVAKHLRTYEWDKEVIPGVLAVGTPGHTPGHTSHIVTSGSSKVYVQADVTHAPFLFARHPGWHAFYDHEPVQAEATRRKVYDMLAAEKLAVQGFHYPFPSVAHVEKTTSGYQEIPMPWSPGAVAKPATQGGLAQAQSMCVGRVKANPPCVASIDVASPRLYIAPTMMNVARIPLNRRRSRSAAGDRV